MHLSEPIMVGQLPERERRVRILLDTGQFERANSAFDEVIIVPPDQLIGEWRPSTILVHRADMAWRLGRVPLAMELAAEGWSELDNEDPHGASAAQTVGMLGYLIEAMAHSDSALRLLDLSVRLAREAGEGATLAHCLVRQVNALLFMAMERDPQRTHERFLLARQSAEEAVRISAPGTVQRAGLAGLARALVGLGEMDTAEPPAWQGLKLSEAAGDWHSAGSAHWALAKIRQAQGNLTEARTMASRALNASERTGDMILITRFGDDLADICRKLADPVGEAAALRRSLTASRQGAEALQETLGQALEQRKLAVQARRLAQAEQQAAIQDPLTGLLNRLGLDRQAPELLQRATLSDQAAWLLLVDVDGFKQVNDTLGHAAGDIVLREVAKIIQRESRSTDLACRWAGDEFVVLLLDTAEESHRAGPAVAERLRANVNNHPWLRLLGSALSTPTISVGVARGKNSLDHMFTAADIALYEAKGGGRNRVAVDRSAGPTSYTEEPVPPSPR